MSKRMSGYVLDLYMNRASSSVRGRSRERKMRWQAVGCRGMGVLCALYALLVLLAALGAAVAEDCAAGGGSLTRSCRKARVATSEDPELDEDSDSAPFMIVVEHEDGWRCSASLVSLRIGVTSARCARGRSTQLPRELWALAAAQLARRPPGSVGASPARHASPVSTARRVTRIALAGDRRRGDDALLDDIAVLELETPFGEAAHARSILMATSRSECEKETACHAVRTVSGEGVHRVRFRVVDAAIMSEAHCSPRVAHWPEVRDRAFCMSGDELCQNDRGTGVVCGGKLCGVLSDSVADEARRSDGCGDTHVAMSVARWRTFLHCAHTLRACGRGDCESLCSEHRLLNGDSTATDTETVETATTLITESSSTKISAVETPHRSEAPTMYSAGVSLAAALAPEQATPPPGRSANLFEPNRPDFKAGEYGDNGAEYEEPAPTTRRRGLMISRSAPRINTVTRTHSTSPSSHTAPAAESLRSTSSAHLYISDISSYHLYHMMLLMIITNLKFGIQIILFTF